MQRDHPPPSLCRHGPANTPVAPDPAHLNDDTSHRTVRHTCQHDRPSALA